MNSTDFLELNLVNKGLKRSIDVTQYDTGRHVKCYVSGISGEIEHASVYCLKPSGKETYTSATVVNDSEVDFQLDPQMIAETGRTECQVQLFGGGNMLTTFEFSLNVSENKITNSQIESTSEYPELLEVLAKLSTYDFVEISESEIDSLEESLESDGGE